MNTTQVSLPDEVLAGFRRLIEKLLYNRNPTPRPPLDSSLDAKERARVRAKERRMAKAAAEGRVYKPLEKVEVTEFTNNTFFDEHYDYIKMCAQCRAWDIAKVDRHFERVQDYAQEIMLLVWKASLYYEQREGGWPPKTFINVNTKWAYASLCRKLNAKKRVFYDSLLHIEDLKLRWPWFDVIDPRSVTPEFAQGLDHRRGPSLTTPADARD